MHEVPLPRLARCVVKRVPASADFPKEASHLAGTVLLPEHEGLLELALQGLTRDYWTRIHGLSKATTMKARITPAVTPEAEAVSVPMSVSVGLSTRPAAPTVVVPAKLLP